VITIFITTFTLGIISSLHCIGMCGPLVLALPKGQNIWLNTLAENSGRILTYTALGVIFAYIGELIKLQMLQQYFSITMGSLIFIYLLFPSFFNKNITENKFSKKVSGIYSTGFKKFLTSKSTTGNFITGLFHGLLPCGMVYIAIATSLLSKDILSTSLAMFFFGLGTSPALIAIMGFGPKLLARWKFNPKSLIQFSMFTMAVILILRGLSLGIPFISPELGDSGCCSTNSF
jgi:uncharacterized protein